jgi:outer membrane protein TolC
MKKTIFSLLVFAVLCGKIYAQTDTIKLSLTQATQLGLVNRYDAKESSLNIAIFENKQIRSKQELLPDISANGKLTYNGSVQPTIVSAGILGFTKPEKIALGMKNNTTLALDLNYTLYKPGLFTDIKISLNDLELEREKKNKSDQDIKIEIALAYDDVLLKLLQYEIAQNNEKRYNEYYDLAGGKFREGALLECDFLQAELDFKNATANTGKKKQNYLLSMQNLKYRINIPEQSILILTDSLQSPDDAMVNADFSDDATVNRSEIRQLLLERIGNELQLRKAKENYLPTLSVFANYTRLFQGADFNYNNEFFWAPVSYVGAKISIPISGSIKTANAVKEYTLKSEQIALRMKQKTADILYEVQEALTKLDNARQNLTVAKDNFSLSQKVYELNKQQYASGSFSYEKLLDTEKSLSTTEQEYISAVYDYLVAKIGCQKASGRF